MKKAIKEALLERRKSDSGDGSIITSLFLLPFVFFFLISAIDVGLYFSNEAHINNAARNASNVTSALGAVGSPAWVSYAESAYPGQATRADLTSATSDFGFTVSNTPEYLLMQELENSQSLYRVQVEDASCAVHRDRTSPSASGIQVLDVGDRPYCTVEWKYDGLPLSFWGFVQATNDSNGEIVPRETTASSASDLLISDRDGTAWTGSGGRAVARP